MVDKQSDPGINPTTGSDSRGPARSPPPMNELQLISLFVNIVENAETSRQFPIAIDALSRALDAARSARPADPIVLSKLLVDLGRNQLASGQEALASASFKEALTTAAGTKSNAIYAITLANVGYAGARYQDLRAIEMFTECIDALGGFASKDPILVPIATARGKMLLTCGKFDEAEKDFLAAVSIAASQKPATLDGLEASLALGSHYAGIKSKASSAHAILSRLDEALESLEPQQSIKDDERHETLRASALQTRAVTLAGERRDAEAIEKSTEALTYAGQNLGTDTLASEIMCWQSVFHASRGDFELALQRVRAANTLLGVSSENHPEKANVCALEGRILASCAGAIGEIPERQEYGAQVREFGGNPHEKLTGTERMPQEVVSELEQIVSEGTARKSDLCGLATRLFDRAEEFFSQAEEIIMKGTYGAERSYFLGQVLLHHLEMLTKAERPERAAELKSTYSDLDPLLAAVFMAAEFNS
jgi:tetratricopeptide (TPR) repeat protein